MLTDQHGEFGKQDLQGMEFPPPTLGNSTVITSKPSEFDISHKRKYGAGKTSFGTIFISGKIGLSDFAP